ncbi:hypothetical protein WAF17_12190 [Bernardetia sp. ABR2-2B]|uniref:hypothetical protein n=1 Tax=Bernardetia sp. ABR2-2B TaxID=3127472 RepID=UPI0030D38785
MKTLFSFMFAATLFFAIQSEAAAQKYFTYDGDTFSVQLKTNSANTQVMEIYFSSEGEWHKFDIVDYHDLTDTRKGGFVYTVKDGKGHRYEVDYRSYADYVVVHNSDYTSEWRLNRR